MTTPLPELGFRNCFRSSNRRRLLRSRRLVVVLDLDHTVLHTISTDAVTINDGADVCPVICNGVSAATKLRPGLRRFLAEIRTFCDVYVFTLGSKPYANAIAEVLNPGNVSVSCFKGIFSREDCHLPGKKTLAVIPGIDEALTVILDDSPEVWEDENRDNVVAVVPYVYFARSTAAPLLAEDEDDDVLKQALWLIRLLHNVVFAGDVDDGAAWRDVRMLLAGGGIGGKIDCSSKRAH